MARTSAGAVRDVLGGDYDNDRSPTLIPYIDSATVIVDRVYTCANNKGITLTTAELELIERWLAAHLYTKSDPVYSSKTTAGKGGSFVRDQQTPEPYKSGAINLDYSGCLNAVLNRLTARMDWLGKPPSDQIDYEDRD